MCTRKSIYFLIFASLVILPGLLCLGTWQWHRADWKQKILATYDARLHAIPLTSLPLKDTPAAADLQFYPVQLTGYFLNDHQFLLDNRTYQQKHGFEVLTPFVINQSKATILVDRGWLPHGKSRQDLPKIPVVEGIQTITGILNTPSKNLVLSQQEEPFTHWPQIIQRLDIDKASHALNLPLQNYILMIKSESPYSFNVNWQPVTVLPNRHIAYAIQWYALALVWVVMCFIVVFRKNRG